MAPREVICIVDCSKRCEPSGYLLNKVYNFLKHNSYELSDDVSSSDSIIINTCCVTEGKKEQSLGEIMKILTQINEQRSYKNNFSSCAPKRIIIFGCVAKAEKDSVILRCKDVIGPNELQFIGPKELDKFNELFIHNIPIGAIGTGILENDLFTSYQEKINLDDYYIMISQGCTNRCAYCNIKNAKGSVLSRKPEEIIQDIYAGMGKGFFTFVLLADDCASYGKDFSGADSGIDFITLVEKIFEIDPRIKVKTSSLYPVFLIDNHERMLSLLSSGRVIYLNVPMESGSDDILSLMNRRYSVEDILSRIKEIRQVSPKTWIYTHMIIGFPKETRTDFVASMKIMKFFDEVMLIAYSDNPNTPASKIFPKISETEISERIRMSNLAMNSQHITGLVVGKDKTYTHVFKKSEPVMEKREQNE